MKVTSKASLPSDYYVVKIETYAPQDHAAKFHKRKIWRCDGYGDAELLASREAYPFGIKSIEATKEGWLSIKMEFEEGDELPGNMKENIDKAFVKKYGDKR